MEIVSAILVSVILMGTIGFNLSYLALNSQIWSFQTELRAVSNEPSSLVSKVSSEGNESQSLLLEVPPMGHSMVENEHLAVSVIEDSGDLYIEDKRDGQT